MKKYLLVIEIKPEKLKSYIQMHQEASGQILQDIRDSGFVNESAWIYENLSIVYFETVIDYAACNDLLRTKELCKKWDYTIIPFFNNPPVFARKIFDLNQQIAGELLED